MPDNSICDDNDSDNSDDEMEEEEENEATEDEIRSIFSGKSVNSRFYAINPPLPSRIDDSLNVIYLLRVVKRRANGDQFTDEEDEIIMHYECFKNHHLTNKFGKSGFVASCLRKMYIKSQYNITGAIEFYILQVPHGQAGFYERLSHVLSELECIADDHHVFGEYRVMKWKRAIRVMERIRLMIKETYPTEKFKVYRGHLDARLAKTSHAKEKDCAAMIYVVDYNFDQAALDGVKERVPDYYELVSCNKPGISCVPGRGKNEVSEKRLRLLLQNVFLPKIRASKFITGTALTIENQVKRKFKEWNNIGGHPVREWIRNTVDSSRQKLEGFINRLVPGSMMAPKVISRQRGQKSLPNSFLVLMMLNNVSDDKICRILERSRLSYERDRKLWECSELRKAGAWQLLKYVTLDSTAMEKECLSSIGKLLGGRLPKRIDYKTVLPMLSETEKASCKKNVHSQVYDQQLVLLLHFTKNS